MPVRDNGYTTSIDRLQVGKSPAASVVVTETLVSFPDGTTQSSAISSDAQTAIDTEAAQRIGAVASYIRTTDGTQTLLAANAVDRAVIITIKIVTSFAAGDGAAPVFDIGETSTVEKFKADLNTGSAGTVNVYTGTLSATKALLVTATAATGTTSTGAIDVHVLALPLA